MKRFIPYIAMFGLLFWITPSYGQSVGIIIQKNIEARGGLKHIKSVKSIEMSGNVNYQGLIAPFTYIIKRPNQMRLEMIVNSDTLIQCYNGKFAWASIPRNGQQVVQKLSESESQALKKQADFDGPLVNYKEKGYKVTYAGEKNIGNEPTYELNLVDPDNHAMTMFIDAHNFHDIRESTTKTIQGSGPQNTNLFKIETDYSNFKSYDGLTLPYEITTKINGHLVTRMKVSKITLNSSYPEKLFQFPVQGGNN